jgi:hypothetical protein
VTQRPVRREQHRITVRCQISNSVPSVLAVNSQA